MGRATFARTSNARISSPRSTVVNAITSVAEEEGHHPDLHVAWGKVGVELWTHAINGLSEADFIMAAKIDRVASAALASSP